jgi:hypothetical protein
MVTAEINHLLLTVTFLHVTLFNFVNAYKRFGGTCNIYLLHPENYRLQVPLNCQCRITRRHTVKMLSVTKTPYLTSLVLLEFLC